MAAPAIRYKEIIVQQLKIIKSVALMLQQPIRLFE